MNNQASFRCLINLIVKFIYIGRNKEKNITIGKKKEYNDIRPN